MEKDERRTSSCPGYDRFLVSWNSHSGFHGPHVPTSTGREPKGDPEAIRFSDRNARLWHRQPLGLVELRVRSRGIGAHQQQCESTVARLPYRRRRDIMMILERLASTPQANLEEG